VDRDAVAVVDVEAREVVGVEEDDVTAVDAAVDVC
jgi:hypothetical protein